MASILDVAKKAGVSTATVSRTFNTPGLLNADTHKRVLEAAKQLNYLPNQARMQNRIRMLNALTEAQTTNRSDAQDAFIGFQFFSYPHNDSLTTNAFYAPVMAGAQLEASNLGMHLLVHTTNRRAMEQELPKMLREGAMSGMLLVGTADPAVLATFLDHVPEIVLVDNRDSTGKHDCIVTDGFAGALDATNYLFTLGHKRIAFLTDDSSVVTFQDRLHGFVCAHYNAGRAVDPEMILATEPGSDLADFARRYLGRPNRPTAIVTSNDMAASQVLAACRDLNIDVPNELSLIGFDDIDLSAQLWPPLTTVRVHKELMGRLAVSRLQSRLQARNASQEAVSPVTIQVPVSLIVRQSCRDLSA